MACEPLAHPALPSRFVAGNLVVRNVVEQRGQRAEEHIGALFPGDAAREPGDPIDVPPIVPAAVVTQLRAGERLGIAKQLLLVHSSGLL